ncbi:hypothetical protein [Actinosynnema sp. NPDC020468]|uniref:hypothetical protein n=1 Tax=Actinosynnema sp. NPDC020468 TaxID=3154488 RepID=UPI0034106892
MRIVAVAVAVVGAVLVPGTANASSWWVTDGYWNDQAECVAEKNMTRTLGFVVSPLGQVCLHNQRGYYYQYLDN